MKYIILLISVFITNLKICTCQDIEQPGNYMTAIANAHTDMNSKYMQYMSAAAHSRRIKKIERLRQQVLESIDNSRFKTIDLPKYKGDNSLRQSSIDYIKLCYAVFSDDYAHIINMQEIAEQTFDEMQGYILLQEKTNEKIKEASESMETASKAFAAKYNVQIINDKDDLGQKLDMSSKVNHYLNEVYLLFLKCNWEDEQITKAIDAKKLNDIEQSRSALLKYADDGLASLDTLKSFDSDGSLAQSCRQALKVYKSIAEKDIPELTDYYLKQENFEKLKKEFERSDSHSKDETNAYNKSVKDVNASVETFNKNNKALYEKRSEIIKNWNDAERDFADNHTPHYK